VVFYFILTRLIVILILTVRLHVRPSPSVRPCDKTKETRATAKN